MHKALRFIAFLALSVVLIAALGCSAEPEAEPEPEATVAPAAKTDAPAPAATEAPATTKAVATSVPEAPAMTVDPSKEFIFNGSFDFSSYNMPAPTQFNEAPMLAARVAAGTLPPVEERLPKASDVLVIPVVERIGDYGGTWRRAFTGPRNGQNADRLMSDHILHFDLDGIDVIPNVVKGWDISDDGLTYTLYLREGMKWSDGSPFTADDWVWYNENVIWNEEINPGREGQIGWSGYHPAVKKVDTYTVQLILPDPGAGFLDMLGTYRTGGYTLHGRIADGLYGPSEFLKTVHRDFAEDKDAYDAKVKEAGFDSWTLYFKERGDPLRSKEVPTQAPWVMTSPITSNLLEFERNPYYYGVDPQGNQLPYIDRIQMQLTEEQEVLNLRAIAGEIDFQHALIQMAKVPVFQENAEQGNYKIMFWETQGTVAGITANISYGLGDVDYDVDPERQALMANKDFRIAMSLAADRNRINQVVFLGLGKPKQQTFNSDHPFYLGEEYESKYVAQDRDEANRLLDGLGYTEKDSEGFRLRKDGEGRINFTMAFLKDYILDFESVVELLREDLAAVGIEVLPKAMAIGPFSAMRQANSHELVVYAGGQGAHRYAANILEWYDVGPAYRNWYVAGGTFTGNAQAEPTHPDILRMVELTDEAKNLRYKDRGENYKETQRILIDNQWIIGLVGYSGAFNGVIVKKNYFRNVPDKAPNQSALQNPGIARTQQFFMEGGKNETE